MFETIEMGNWAEWTGNILLIVGFVVTGSIFRMQNRPKFSVIIDQYRNREKKAGIIAFTGSSDFSFRCINNGYGTGGVRYLGLTYNIGGFKYFLCNSVIRHLNKKLYFIVRSKLLSGLIQLDYSRILDDKKEEYERVDSNGGQSKMIEIPSNRIELNFTKNKIINAIFEDSYQKMY